MDNSTNKNKAMRAAVAVMVATVLSTCVVGGVFAKYITDAQGSDSSRVAHWGWGTSSLDLGNLFSATYAYDSDGEGNSVIGGADVIAPGTQGQAVVNFAYSGINGATAPEVAYKFTVAVSGACSNPILGNENIEWALAPSSTDPASVEYSTWDNLLTALNKLDGTEGSEGKEYAAGTLPKACDDTALTSYTIYWRWNLDDGTTTHTYWMKETEDTQNPIVLTINPHTVDYTQMTQTQLDTYMGNMSTPAAVSLSVTITAEQID